MLYNNAPEITIVGLRNSDREDGLNQCFLLAQVNQVRNVSNSILKLNNPYIMEMMSHDEVPDVHLPILCNMFIPVPRASTSVFYWYIDFPNIAMHDL